MENWTNKVAVVTGASSGIGAAVVRKLANTGAIVIGLARRVERMEELHKLISEEFRENFHPMKCDVGKSDEVVSVFEEIDKTFGAISILVNCAGVLKQVKLLDRSSSKDLRETIDTNLFGTVFCVREVYHLMKKHGVDDGRIVNIDSILGHRFIHLGLLNLLSSLNIYPSSKFAITACNEVWRQEFINDNSNIKLTSVNPGLVRTNIYGTAIKAAIKFVMPHLVPSDVADAVLHALRSPDDVQVQDLTIRAVGEPF